MSFVLRNHLSSAAYKLSKISELKLDSETEVRNFNFPPLELSVGHTTILISPEAQIKRKEFTLAL